MVCGEGTAGGFRPFVTAEAERKNVETKVEEEHISVLDHLDHRFVVGVGEDRYSLKATAS